MSTKNQLALIENEKKETSGTIEITIADLEKVLEQAGILCAEKPDRAAGSSQPPENRPPATLPKATQSITYDLPKGKMIDGRYEVIRRLGVGAMGTVFLVKHLRLNKPFALKVINPKLVEQPAYVARFEREALSCSLLDHPNCISVTDFGRTEEGVTYLVMEYVDGVALSGIAKTTELSIAEAMEYTRQILVGLEHAHAKGLVHRDIKLENLVKSTKENGDVIIKILDFGMAKPVARQVECQFDTQPRVVVGTPQYLAPELIRNKEPDERTDLYSVGICLYRMITGTPVFEGDTLLELLTAKMRKPAPPLKAATSIDYPEALEAFVKTALQREPQDRFQSAAEMLKALDRVKSQINKEEQPESTKLERPKSNRAVARYVTGLAAMLVFLLLTIGAFFFVGPKAGQRYGRFSGFIPPPELAEGSPERTEQVGRDSEQRDLHPGLHEAKLLIEVHRCLEAEARLLSIMDDLGSQKAIGYYLLGQSSMCVDDYRAALTRYKQAIELNDHYRLDGIIAEHLKRMTTVKKVSADAMLFIRDVLGDAAIPIFVYLAAYHNNMEIRHQALAHVASSGMLKHVNMSESLGWDLNQTRSCSKRKQIIAKLGMLGTFRARTILERARDLEKQKDSVDTGYVHSCVREDIIATLKSM